MTIDEILNMPAGRELDVFVLREVMKYKPSYVQEGSLFGVAGELDCWYDEDGRFYPLGTSPSTDISAAWEVVEKIRQEPCLSNETFARFVDVFHSEYACFDISEFLQILTPLKICRAALLAVLDAGEKQAENP